jgi:hypothetical protein
MQTLLAEARPAKVANLDYEAEFAAREAEIEAAERAKAVIVVEEDLRHQLDKNAAQLMPVDTGCKDLPPQTMEPVFTRPTLTLPPDPPRAVAAGIQAVVNGKNLELALDLFPSCAASHRPSTRQRTMTAAHRVPGRLPAQENLVLLFDE